MMLQPSKFVCFRETKYDILLSEFYYPNINSAVSLLCVIIYTLQPVLRTTTKKRQYLVRSCRFSSFCRRFCRFVVVFFVFISFRLFSRLLSVRNDRFFVVFLSFLTSFFCYKKSSFFDGFFVV